MRSMLTIFLAVTVLAVCAAAAAARPAMTSGRVDAARHAQTIRRLGRRVEANSPGPIQVVHVIRAPLADGGFEWADAGIGAGFAVALLLTAGGVSVIRRHSALPTR